MYKIEKILRDPYYVIGWYLKKNHPRLMSDKYFLKVVWKHYMGYDLNLKIPQTFNEKLQWLKLYDRKPIYSFLVDKIRVKEYISSIVGSQYTVPTLATYLNTKEISFYNLPDSFVLKCNHDSGSTIICKDKSVFDFTRAAKFLDAKLQQDYYLVAREWPYKDVPRKIIAEPLLYNKEQSPIIDYKLMVFNGSVKCLFVCTNRNTDPGLNVTFFDTDWKRLPFERKYPSDKNIIERPVSFKEMISIAELLCQGIPFSRVDFYEIDSHPVVGEITLYPGAGYEPFIPDTWDRTLGDWLILPSIT